MCWKMLAALNEARGKIWWEGTQKIMEIFIVCRYEKQEFLERDRRCHLKSVQ